MLILGGAWPFSRLRTQKVSWPEGSWLDKINGRTKPGPPDRLACAWCRAEGTSPVRGTYYDQWQPERQPNEARSFDGFLKEVARGLASIRPVNSPDATQLSSTYFHSTSIAVRWNRSANRCAKTCGGYGRRAPWVMPRQRRIRLWAIRIDRSAELRTLEAMRSNPCAAVSPRRLLDPTA